MSDTVLDKEQQAMVLRVCVLSLMLSRKLMRYAFPQDAGDRSQPK